MTQDPHAAAMERYHDRFDNARYTAIAEFVASNLNAGRDEKRVTNLLVAAQNAAFELCGHSLHMGAGHTLAVHCGQHYLSFHTVDAIRDFLHLFAPDDVRIDDFESTAKAMLRAYSGLSTIRSRRKCIVIAYPLCDNADYRYSIGIHMMFVRFLDTGEIARFSGIWFEEALP